MTATLIRDFDMRLANPEKKWKYHTLFVVVPHGWSVFMKRRQMRVGVTEKGGFVERAVE